MQSTLNQTLLNIQQQLATSGARSAVPYQLDGQLYLAIPQLAEDNQGQAPNMNGGNSDIYAQIFQWNGQEFQAYQQIPCHGGESMNFFTIGNQAFMALANIRSGDYPTYNYNTYSQVYTWDGHKWYPFQQFKTFACKNCYSFTIEERHFLAFAEGVYFPDQDPAIDTSSHIYEWKDGRFELFQSLPGKWGYGWTLIETAQQIYLAFADHVGSSILYKWQDGQFASSQEFATSGGGRHFLGFHLDGDDYLAFAILTEKSMIYRLENGQYVPYQTLEEGVGGRNFHLLQHQNNTYLFRTNFITGTKDAPITEMKSQIYQWKEKKFTVAQEYTTLGGTESSPFQVNDQIYVAVSNSLSKEVRFSTPTNIYRFEV